MSLKSFSLILTLINSLVAMDVRSEKFLTYSYLALIGKQPEGSTELSCISAGTVVTSRLILTTTHCYEGDGKWVAIVGSSAIGKSIEIVDSWILHPHFAQTTYVTYNDVAVLVMRKPIDLKCNRIQPFSLSILPAGMTEYDLKCKMVGWKIIDLKSITIDDTSPDFQDLNELLGTVYVLKKTFHSLRQCDSIISLTPDVDILIDETFFCIKHAKGSIDDLNYGLIGSPLICETLSLEKDQWSLVGMKIKPRAVEKNIPELFINLRPFRKYLEIILDNPMMKPYIYFCSVSVCGKKYQVYGDYCLDGDDEECYRKDFPPDYFPLPAKAVQCYFYKCKYKK